MPTPSSSSLLNPRNVAIFDGVAVIVFALIARMSHNSADLPFSLLGVLQTAWPFLLGTVIGWLILVFGLRAAHRAAELKPGLVVWGCTVLSGVTIWGIKHAAFPRPLFMLISAVTTAILMLIWRGIVSARKR